MRLCTLRIAFYVPRLERRDDLLDELIAVADARGAIVLRRGEDVLRGIGDLGPGRHSPNTVQLSQRTDRDIPAFIK